MSTPFGLRRHKGLTLGVTNAFENYEQALERKVFYNLQNVHNISDDVIIWGKSQHEHGFSLQKDLQQVREYGVTLKKESVYSAYLKLHFSLWFYQKLYLSQ